MSGLIRWSKSDKNEASPAAGVRVTAVNIEGMPWILHSGVVFDVELDEVPSILVRERFVRGDLDGIYQAVSLDGAQWDERAPEISENEKTMLKLILAARERGG